MVGISLPIAILLLSVGTASVACTLYTDRADSVRDVNRLMYAMGLSLLLWNFGLALRVTAASRAVAVAASHIAPFGYGALFGFLLHYVLALTGCRRALHRWWVYPLIYLPGAVTILGLSVLPFFGLFPYRLAKTWMGWVNDTENVWLWFYYLYYAVYLGIISWLLIRWGRRSRKIDTRRQARALLNSILAMAALGSLTDAVPALFGLQLPGLASAFAVLPVYSISYSVKTFHFMKPAVLKPSERILKNETHDRRVYRLLSIGFCAGSGLTLLSRGRMIPYAVPDGPFVFSFVMALSGGLILVFSRLPIDERFRELLVSFVFAFFIPCATLIFDWSGNVTMWTLLFLIWIPGILFNRGILLRAMLVASFQAQLVAMGMAATGRARIGPFDYMIQAGILLLAACLCFFINCLYRNRLRENARHTAGQTLVTEISHRLLLADETVWDASVHRILADSGRFFGCGQAYLVISQPGSPAYVGCWREKSLSPVRGALDSNRNAFFSTIWRLVENHPTVAVWQESARPDSCAGWDVCLRQMHIRSLAAAPICPDGRMAGFLCFGSADTSRSWKGQETCVAILTDMIADTFAKMRSNRRIRHAAYHDRLTGLPNRMLLRERLDHALSIAGDSGQTLAVVYFDVDSFKSVNDSMGHEQGDRLLQQVALRLTGQSDRWDTVARVGGDEFVLVHPITGEESVSRRIERTMRAVRQPVMLENQEFFVTGSAGVALYPRDGTSAEELLANADGAMYQAKSSGRNQCVFCSPHMRDQLAGRMRLTAQLYTAQAKDQLEVYYQPQVNLATHRIVGLEALLRWNLPGRGMIDPAEFIPLAEQTGLILPMGAWVLENACRQCRRWMDKGLPPVRMSVNVSLQQLRSACFPDKVAEILRRTGMPPDRLELEVSESVATGGSEDIPQYMARLKKLGVAISIDDFGTGYSSLSRLKLLPVDRLKLDIQFVHGIERDEKDRAISKVIISLAKSLHLRITAEGVETAAQLAFLNERLCDEVQGFYYYHPMPAAEAEQVLAAGIPDSGINLA